MPKSTRKKRPPRSARNADKHELYQLAVQAPDVDVPFLARWFARNAGRPPRTLREDFCGTALLACHWVLAHTENRAIGVDLDAPTLAWGRTHNVATLLDDEQRTRLRLIRSDVRRVGVEAVDLVVAFNFSYSLFKTRDALREYFVRVRDGLRRGGALVIDAWGGSETQDVREERRRVADFTYCWDQHDFDPVSYHCDCRIHFRFQDGSVMRNAFRYEWRLWTLPELVELMREAGFSDVQVLMEGTERDTGRGNGVFRRVLRAGADPAWIGYVAGRA